MIRIIKTTVAMSVQDQGRFGSRALGHARSGAMDPLALATSNAAAGAPPSGAGIEIGPGPCSFAFEHDATIAWGGASRDGIETYRAIVVAADSRLDIGAARQGVWSYLSVQGGVEAPETLGSRSTSVREGIGSWLKVGDVISAGDDARDPQDVDAPTLASDVRIFGEMPGDWRVGTRCDRLGYMLDGDASKRGAASEWSEPLLPGFIQITPSGAPIVIMPEGPTVGGYPVAAVVHADDLRLIAQTRAGDPVRFIPAE